MVAKFHPSMSAITHDSIRPAKKRTASQQMSEEEPAPKWHAATNDDRIRVNNEIHRLMSHCAEMSKVMHDDHDAQVSFAYAFSSLLNMLAGPLAEFNRIDHKALHGYMTPYAVDVYDNLMMDGFTHDWKACEALLNTVGYHF
jgi:hypothetical protein